MWACVGMGQALARERVYLLTMRLASQHGCATLLNDSLPHGFSHHARGMMQISPRLEGSGWLLYKQLTYIGHRGDTGATVTA